MLPIEGEPSFGGWNLQAPPPSTRNGGVPLLRESGDTAYVSAFQPYQTTSHNQQRPPVTNDALQLLQQLLSAVKQQAPPQNGVSHYGNYPPQLHSQPAHGIADPTYTPWAEASNLERRRTHSGAYGREALAPPNSSASGNHSLIGMKLPITCNNCQGVLCMDQQIVACHCEMCDARVAAGHDRPIFSLTRFERHTGSKAKKWRLSLRIEPGAVPECPPGTNPLPLGQWLEMRGLHTWGTGNGSVMGVGWTQTIRSTPAPSLQTFSASKRSASDQDLRGLGGAAAAPPLKRMKDEFEAARAHEMYNAQYAAYLNAARAVAAPSAPPQLPPPTSALTHIAATANNLYENYLMKAYAMGQAQGTNGVTATADASPKTDNSHGSDQVVYNSARTWPKQQNA